MCTRRYTEFGRNWTKPCFLRVVKRGFCTQFVDTNRDQGELGTTGLGTMGPVIRGQVAGNSAGSGAKVGVKPRRRQKSSTRATVSGVVWAVVRRRICAPGLPARSRASAAMATHLPGR